jgi:hypothetical protein
MRFYTSILNCIFWHFNWEEHFCHKRHRIKPTHWQNMMESSTDKQRKTWREKQKRGKENKRSIRLETHRIKQIHWQNMMEISTDKQRKTWREKQKRGKENQKSIRLETLPIMLEIWGHLGFWKRRIWFNTLLHTFFYVVINLSLRSKKPSLFWDCIILFVI